MDIYPAIDIKDGKCVRLSQGRFENATVYSTDPVAMAIRWQEAGAKRLHIVDLDGAKSGVGTKSRRMVLEMASILDIPIQLGGGIRSMKQIENCFELGVSRVILGTVAVQQPEIVEQAVNEYPGKIIVGIDARDGKVAIKGWVELSSYNAVEFASDMKTMGVDTVVYTDIVRDGMMSGPNIATAKEIMDKTGLNVIVSGGISKPDHLDAAEASGAKGVIIGKALYEGTISLVDAIKYDKE